MSLKEFFGGMNYMLLFYKNKFITIKLLNILPMIYYI